MFGADRIVSMRRDVVKRTDVVKIVETRFGSFMFLLDWQDWALTLGAWWDVEDRTASLHAQLGPVEAYWDIEF
jgi:hypothetical protein